VVKPNLTYRRDIDGLRAIAVLSVIFYHAGIVNIPGGFVGVDIFFVISGYLITQRIISGHRKGGFSFKQFYVRRIRRIFPAMVTTLLGTLLAGTLLLDPDSLVRLGRSTISAALSVSNIHFYLESGYWDTASWMKPLLHTWSLGVEEQFYIIWPLFVICLLMFTRGFSLAVLVVITLASLVVTTLFTPENHNAAFYLTPFRIYEFGIGAICVWFDQHVWPKNPSGKLLQSALYLLGLAVLFSSICLIDNTDTFPGWMAVIPALGAAFVILAKEPAGLSLLLSNAAMRYTGLISYSLYLVHWPVLVFFKYKEIELSTDTTIFALIIIAALSALQYHFIENPLRRPASRNINYVTNTTFAAAIVAVLFVTSNSILVVMNHGFPGRYSKDIQQLTSLTLKNTNKKRFRNQIDLCNSSHEGNICGSINTNAVNVLIVGDSHGPDGLNIFKSAFPYANYVTSYLGGCPLVRDLTGITHATKDCAYYNLLRFAQINHIIGDIDYVVFSQRMSLNRVEAMKETLKWFADRDVGLIVLGAGPQYKYDLVSLIIRHGTIMRSSKDLDAFSVKHHFIVDDILGPYVESLGGIYLRMQDFFCPDGMCLAVLDSEVPIMFDTHHLTLEASQAFGKYLYKTNKNLLKQRHKLN